MPAGWDRWLGLVGNSRYYGYAVNDDGKTVQHGHDYAKDYLTDVIKNASVAWLEGHLAAQAKAGARARPGGEARAKAGVRVEAQPQAGVEVEAQPILAVLHTPAPHRLVNGR